MIPRIITINEGDDSDKILSDFATECGIELAYRIVVQPEKEELTVEQIHLMQKDIQVSFSKMVLVALKGVDDSSIEVQNSLLKCLEEDAERIQFLFLVKNPARLLSTILSRSSLLYIYNTAPTDKLALIKDVSDLFSFQNNSDATKEDAVERIDSHLLSSLPKDMKTLHHLLVIRKLIIDNNMNPLLALDNILIFLSKTSTMNASHGKKQ